MNVSYAPSVFWCIIELAYYDKSLVLQGAPGERIEAESEKRVKLEEEQRRRWGSSDTKAGVIECTVGQNN